MSDELEFRYHPLLENVKVNEDGSIIIRDGIPLNIVSRQLPHTRNVSKVVYLKRTGVNTIRLVCEAWHGISPTGEHAARRVDEAAGDHYSNLYWGKKGMTLSAAKGVVQPTLKMTPEVYANIKERNATEPLRAILKELDISENRFYHYQRKHVKKDK